MGISKKTIFFSLGLVVITVVCKVAFGAKLEWSGFSPVLAIALFAGMIYGRNDRSFLLPLIALFISDAVIEILHRFDLFVYGGFYSGQWLNYLIILAVTLLGWLLKGKKNSAVLAGAAVAPTGFFLISNFMVWLGNTVAFTRDFSGLMTCYAAGLPFYRNALIATMIFLPLILVTYNLVRYGRFRLTLA